MHVRTHTHKHMEDGYSLAQYLQTIYPGSKMSPCTRRDTACCCCYYNCCWLAIAADRVWCSSRINITLPLHESQSNTVRNSRRSNTDWRSTILSIYISVCSTLFDEIFRVIFHVFEIGIKFVLNYRVLRKILQTHAEKQESSEQDWTILTQKNSEYFETYQIFIYVLCEYQMITSRCATSCELCHFVSNKI